MLEIGADSSFCTCSVDKGAWRCLRRGATYEPGVKPHFFYIHELLPLSLSGLRVSFLSVPLSLNLQTNQPHPLITSPPNHRVFHLSHHFVRPPDPAILTLHTFLPSSMTTIFIGKLIQEELRVQQKSVVWLARELGCNRTNIYKIFNRRSIDAELLLRISRVLGRNFFKPYIEHLD